MSDVYRVSWEMDIEAAHSAEAAEKALTSIMDVNNMHTFFRVYSFPIVHCFSDESINNGMPIVADGPFAPCILMVNRQGIARMFRGFDTDGTVITEEE